jgi:ABC-type hemin transport system ATPase subunit
VVFLQSGRVAAEGPTTEMLTGERLSALFGAPITVTRNREYFSAHA